MTSKSFNRWFKIKNYSNKIFNKFDLCLAQNSETEKRLNALGAKKILNIGNLKFTTSKYVKNEFLDKKKLNFFNKKHILVTAASTHFDEEKFIIKSHLYFLKKRKAKNIISIIIPRHIERVNEIINDLKEFSLKYHLHSSNKTINKDINIYLVDTYGELNKFYKISDLVFMGGSLIEHGGQNPLEAAKLGCRIIHGPNIINFEEIYKKLSFMGISEKFGSNNERDTKN